MEVRMTHPRKTTILLPPELHDRLTRIARQQNTSLDELVRRACEAEYGEAAAARRLVAARLLASMDLPVDTPERMKAESVAEPKDLVG
jgi:hypothetical protein